MRKRVRADRDQVESPDRVKMLDKQSVRADRDQVESPDRVKMLDKQSVRAFTVSEAKRKML